MSVVADPHVTERMCQMLTGLSVRHRIAIIEAMYALHLAVLPAAEQEALLAPMPQRLRSTVSLILTPPAGLA